MIFQNCIDFIFNFIIISLKEYFMGRVVVSDASSLTEKVVNFIKFRSKNGKPFKQMTYWENAEYDCHFADDSIYIDLITGQRQKVNMPKDECAGLFSLPQRNIEKSLTLKYFSEGQRQDNLIVECYITDVQDENNPHIVREIYSFVSTMVDKDPNNIVQLQRYDLSGRYIHQNKIIEKLAKNNEISDEELKLLEQYFQETAQFPHFHFSSNSFGDKLAISLDNLIKYVCDLISRDDENLNKYSLGMPFLKIKQQWKYSQTDVPIFIENVKKRLNKLAIKYKGAQEKSIIEKINSFLYGLDLADLTTSSIETCLYKLVILKILGASTPGGSKKLYENQTNNKGEDGIDRSGGGFGSSNKDNHPIDPRFVKELNALQLEIANKISTDLEIERDYERDNNDFDNGREL